MDNPAYDYDGQKPDYAAVRRADPRIGRPLLEALADCTTVLNVGAGTGSYEPLDKYVVAVEPAATMRAQRLALGRGPAVVAKADALPFDDGSFDAVMAVLTIHHWPDLEAGLRELKRVARRKVCLMTYDPDQLDVFWNVEYFPELVEVERRRYPGLGRLEAVLGPARATIIPIPLDCTDGFQEAFYGRPEAFLDPRVRKAQSAWGFLDASSEGSCVGALEAALTSGAWDERWGHLRRQATFEGAYRLLEYRV